MQLLDRAPAVVMLGPRQVGKTTLAISVGERRSSVYFDLERETDRLKLADVEQALGSLTGTLAILDEVHRAPELFSALRGLIDRRRRQGQRYGQFLLLGSASLDLMRQTGESLAGRIALLELAPFDVTETDAQAQPELWSRGGFPDSFLAADAEESLRWRRDFIRTYLERDVPQFGARIPAEMLRRFWTMLAHRQGALLNAAELARSLEVDGKSIARYLDLLVDLLLVRRLQPLHRNVGKRLVKSPKVFIRDSGICHALLGIRSLGDLTGHPVVGASWEGFVIENLLSVAPDGTRAYFYRTTAGAEIDLVLELPGGDVWAIEIKRSLAPKVERGFHVACADIAPTRKWIVSGGSETFPISSDIVVIGLRALAAELIARR